ncbi:MAG: hypothetical protein ACREML_13380 [Vulcanimicrobiaceae bacterium]
MKKMVIAPTLLLWLMPVASLAQTNSADDRAGQASQGVLTYDATNLILSGGY